MEELVMRFIDDDLFKLSLSSRVQNDPSRRTIVMVEHIHEVLNQMIDNSRDPHIPPEVLNARDAINALYAILPGSQGHPIMIPEVLSVIET